MAKSIVGHASSVINDHYTHISANDTQKSINALPDVTK